ncbi:MAG TPA: hypothetical protein PLB88_09530 [Thermoanaerobaculaceae bacterium]|nr:MAG: hypothetical protein B7Z61_03870 [Acidobacteria bacterium 37-71-11]HQT93670.1 hypothetical protein [Thermoanaerobaculaceae bacterium]HQU34544.1 hypothetical protein [Thermoanaerobaculaceae bacterium]
MNVLVRWQTFVGGVRHKPAIGIAVLMVGIIWLVIGDGGVASTVGGFLAGLGAGIVILGFGDR